MVLPSGSPPVMRTLPVESKVAASYSRATAIDPVDVQLGSTTTGYSLALHTRCIVQSDALVRTRVEGADTVVGDSQPSALSVASRRDPFASTTYGGATLNRGVPAP